MSRLMFIFFFVFYAYATCAQKAIIKEVRETAPVSKEKYVFPLVIIPGNKIASNKINQKLREDILNLDSAKFKQSIFEEVWQIKEHDGRWIYTDFSYKILSNTHHYLALTVTFVGGRHSETQIRKYHFDTFTGDEISLDILLNQNGMRWLAGVIKKGQGKRIRRILASFEDSLKKHQASNDSLNIAYDEDILRLYNNCSDEQMMAYLEFSVKNNRVYFSGGRCGDSWDEMRVDELGDYTFSIPIRNCGPYLSAYGKKILQFQSLYKK